GLHVAHPRGVMSGFVVLVEGLDVVREMLGESGEVDEVIPGQLFIPCLHRSNYCVDEHGGRGKLSCPLVWLAMDNLSGDELPMGDELDTEVAISENLRRILSCLGGPFSNEVFLHLLLGSKESEASSKGSKLRRSEIQSSIISVLKDQFLVLQVSRSRRKHRPGDLSLDLPLTFW